MATTAELSRLKATRDADASAATRAETTAANAASAAKTARAKADASAAAYAAALAPPPKPTPAPQPAPPVATKPPVATTPAPTPAPPVAPVPAPPAPKASADARYLDRSILKTPLLDWTFADKGLGLQSAGGPWDTVGWWGGDGARAPSASMEAWWADKTLGADLDLHVIQPDGLHLLLRENTPALKARFPQFASSRLVSAQLRLQHPGGPPEGFYPLHPGALGWIPRPRANMPNIVEIDPQGCYVQARAKVCGLQGQWGQICFYSYDGNQLIEFDLVEVAGNPKAWSSPNYHKHFGSTPAYPTPIRHTNIMPVPADGSPYIVPGGRFVTFGVIMTPGRIRAYQEDILVADYEIDNIREPLMMQLANQAKSDDPGGPMALADLTKADLVIESVKVWAV